MSMKTFLSRWLSFLVPVLLIFPLSGCAFVNVPLMSSMRPLEEKVVDGEGRVKILILDVTGAISEDRRRGPAFSENPSIVDEFREELKKVAEG